MQTLSEDFFLRDHNTEIYVLDQMHQKLNFLNLFPLHDNETGEFTSFVMESSADKDMAEGVMSEPIGMDDGSEFTEIDMTDYKPILGATSVKGYSISYGKKVLRQNRLSATMQLRLSKAISGFAQHYDSQVFGTLCAKAGVTGPTLSDWSDVDEIDPDVDNLSIQQAFDNDKFGYQATDVFLNAQEFYNLAKYIISDDRKAYATKEVKLGDVTYHKLLNSIPTGHYLAMDSNVPAGVIEKYVDPDYSTVRKAEIEGKNAEEVPASLINVHSYKSDKQIGKTTVNLWAEMAMNVQEPNTLIYGAFGSE